MFNYWHSQRNAEQSRELKGYFERKEQIGAIDKNNDYGIFGYINDFNYKNIL